MGAHLLTRLDPWPGMGEIAEGWEERVAAPFRAFTSRNIRTVPLLSWLALPWRWPHTTIPVEALARRYERDLTALRLSDLPAHPRCILNATDMTYGVSWRFTRREMGDYLAGMRSPGNWTLGRAVAASSCFPPVFDAMEVGVGEQDVVVDRAARREGVLDVRLTDGGVYDNLGLEPVWKTAQTVLVSDGGGVFHHEASKNILDRILRYPSIASNQVVALRKRWLIASFTAGQMQGAYWGIASTAAHYQAGAVGYSEALVTGIIAAIRTDLDSFSAAEAAVLENHGYCLAEAAIREHRPEMPVSDARPFAVPHPDWMDEDRVRRELRASNVRTILGRGWKEALPAALRGD